VVEGGVEPRDQVVSRLVPRLLGRHGGRRPVEVGLVLGRATGDGHRCYGEDERG
jgi:hypothetical protein